MAPKSIRNIIFESNGPCGSEEAYNTVEIPSSIAIYMQERHEANSIDNPGDSIEARSRIIHDPEYKGEYDNTKLNDGLGISSWPATLMMLMGFVPPADYDKSMINLK